MRIWSIASSVTALVMCGQVASAVPIFAPATPQLFSSKILNPTTVGFAPSINHSVVSNQFASLGVNFAGGVDPNVTAPSSFFIDTSVLVALASFAAQVEWSGIGSPRNLGGPQALLRNPGRGSGAGGLSGGGFTGGGGSFGGGGSTPVSTLFSDPKGGGSGGGTSGSGGSTRSPATVPLPMSAPLLALGLMGLGLMRRKRS